MTDNRTTELKSLSKLKMAGKLRYWRGTIEMPETELHAIYDEIQAEHDRAVAATLGNEREAKLIRAMEDVLRHATDTVWVSEIETLVDRMVSLGVYGCEVYEGVRPWEATNER